MGKVKCTNPECRGVMLAGDRFCGTCGTLVPERASLSAPNFGATGGAASGAARPGAARGGTSNYGTIPASREPTSATTRRPVASPGASPIDAPFFSHEPQRRSGPFSNATRFLCAAAYLDYGFANKVILNLLVTRRAVAPSVNFDVGPVLRHCLRARRHILIRDLVLVLIVFIGLVVQTLPTLGAVLIACVCGGALTSVGDRSGGAGARLVRLLVTVGVAGLAVVLIIFLVGRSLVSSVFSGGSSGGFSGGGFSGGGFSIGSAVAGLAGLVFAFAVILGALAATEFVYLRATARALAGGSRQDDERRAGTSRAAQQRMAVVEGAQWGNITLHSEWFPFIGAGTPTKSDWSVATPLRARSDGDQDTREPRPGDGYVPIDPVDLHRFIGEQLRALNDPALPENERITALTVSDRLVGTGWVSEGNPLFDKTSKTPYSHASREAVEALIRYPQARLRYYQQVSVNDESPAVMSYGRKVIDDLDQEIAVSAFVYAAVEGRRLYLQFVLTALPPIDPMYRVSRLSYATSTSSTLAYAFKRLFSSLMSAVPGIYGAFRLWRKEQQLERLYLSASGGDYGARISVRELGTADKFSRYMQVLDVDKYNSIISQALLDSVTKYLAARGIDTSVFTGAAQNIINNINNGTIHGDLNQQAGNNNNNSNNKANGQPQQNSDHGMTGR